MGKKTSKSVRKRFDINVLKAYEEKNKKKVKKDQTGDKRRKALNLMEEPKSVTIHQNCTKSAA